MVSVPCGEITSVFQLDPLLSNYFKLLYLLMGNKDMSMENYRLTSFPKVGKSKVFFLIIVFFKIEKFMQFVSDFYCASFLKSLNFSMPQFPQL